MNLPRRIDKFVREATKQNLAFARAALRAGAVTCKRLAQPGSPIDETSLVFDQDTIVLSGQKLELPKRQHTYLLNKPISVTCSAHDPEGKQDLSAWLGHMAPGTFPVGRLDRESTGALLCTTDSELAGAVLRPDQGTDKVYWLWLNESLTGADPRLAKWLTGVPMDGGEGKAEAVSIFTSTEHMTEVLVTLREGKNRQLRRMCRAVDFRLLHLHRRSIGPLSVKGMALGEVRELSTNECRVLWRALGGIEQIRAKKREALVLHANNEREGGSPNVLLEEWLAAHPPNNA